MSAYINLDTMEYPRHPGDVALDPTANWEIVNETEIPECEEYEVAEESFPENIGGIWFKKWVIRPMTIEERALTDNPRPGPLHEWNSTSLEWYLPEQYLL